MSDWTAGYVADSGAQLFDEAFDAFCSRPELPEFDYIGLHGIWSWISDENRSVIVDFVRRKLKVGGVLYISYNTQPGWAAMVPMRDLLTEHAEVLGSNGAGIVSRIDSALAFADQLLAANTLDAIDAVNLTAEQQTLLAGIPDPMFRQAVRDFCVNQQFCKDYWVKGARKLSALEQLEALRAQRVILAQPRADVSLKVTGQPGRSQSARSDRWPHTGPARRPQDQVDYPVGTGPAAQRYSLRPDQRNHHGAGQRRHRACRPGLGEFRVECTGNAEPACAQGGQDTGHR